LSVLNNIEPKRVFHYFEEISSIPRGSKKEEKISSYLVNFARYRGLQVIQDEALNVIIRKQASPGYEDLPGIILQGHMDMVWEKNQDKDFDFESQGIKLIVENDWISADNTTLGADNGIALAFCLAVLDSEDIHHPSLEILITSDEETGMTGAKELDSSSLKGKFLINIDTEEEGALYVSCAGGLRFKVSVPFQTMPVIKNNFFKIKISGLKGGHSGADIILQRSNSIKTFGKILKKLSFENDIYLADISGGSKENAIPREAEAFIYIENPDEKSLEETIKNINTQLKKVLYLTDPNIQIDIKKTTDTFYKVLLDKESTNKLINTILLHPSGIDSMSSSIENFVESSLNLGRVRLENKTMIMESLIRSSKEQKLDYLSEDLMALAELSGGSYEAGARYPPWDYLETSRLKEHMISVYKSLFGKDLQIKAIHAGLECGILKNKLPNVDMVSFGPDIRNAHTPQEKLSISSTKKTWEFLLKVLKDFKINF
jgi:dipeptidase D